MSWSGEDRSRTITAEDIANIRDIGGHHSGAISVSPDGRYVAFQLQTPNIEARKYDLSWYVMETGPSGTPRKIDDGGDIILNPNLSPVTLGDRPQTSAQWSSDSQWIFYLKRIDNSTQLWRSKISGAVPERLTHNAADVLSFLVSDNGAKVFFFTAIADGDFSDQRLEEGDRGFHYDERFYPHNKRLPSRRTCDVNGEGRVIEVAIRRVCSPRLLVYNLETAVEHIADSDEIAAYQRSITLSPWEAKGNEYVVDRSEDGNLIWLKNESPERFPGYVPPMRLFATVNGKEFRCSAKECYAYKGMIEDAWWRPGGREILFQRADNGSGTYSKSMTSLFLWDPRSTALRRIMVTEDKLSDCHALENKAICLREQWTHPRTISSIDLETGAIRTLFDPNPEFHEFEVPEVEKIMSTDDFGNPAHGHLVYPLNYEEGRRYPLVVTTYTSRGFLRGGTGDEYPIIALAANGFMILSYNQPSRFERDAVIANSGQAQFENLYERRSDLSALENILDTLEDRTLIDRNRVAITGLSDGADQVMFALIHTNRFAAAIASSLFDWRAAYYSYNRSARAFWRHVLGGAPYEDKKTIYKSMSIGLNSRNINAPVLINVSDQELLDSVESFVRLQDAGRPIEMYVFPDEYHIKWQPQHRLAIYRRNIQWLKFWLMNEEDPNPVDSSQYKRWERLRECPRLPLPSHVSRSKTSAGVSTA